MTGYSQRAKMLCVVDGNVTVSGCSLRSCVLLSSVPEPEPGLRLCKGASRLLDLLPEPHGRLFYGFL